MWGAVVTDHYPKQKDSGLNFLKDTINIQYLLWSFNTGKIGQGWLRFWFFNMVKYHSHIQDKQNHTSTGSRRCTADPGLLEPII